MYTFKTEEEIIASAKYIMEKSFKKTGCLIDTVNASGEYFQLRLANNEREVFSVMFLNAKHQMIACEDLFFGTVNGASVYPREVLKRAMHHNAVAVVLAHNHPSGNTEPSTSDKAITERLKSLLEVVDVNLLDHIIVSPLGWLSFAEGGILHKTQEQPHLIN